MSQRDEPNLVYGEGTERLSQLSDIVSLSQENEQSEGAQLRAQSLPSAQGCLLDFVEDLPSQAVLPTPELPFASQRNDTSGACEARNFGPEITSDSIAEPVMLSEADEQCYVPERSKSSRRATRRGSVSTP